LSINLTPFFLLLVLILIPGQQIIWSNEKGLFHIPVRQPLFYGFAGVWAMTL